MVPVAERRNETRTPTAFFAVEVRGEDVFFRLVRDISPNGFFFEDHFPFEKPGDAISMEFPLPGSPDPIRVDGEVVHARADVGVGVRIKEVDVPSYARLLAVPPPAE